MYVYGYMYVYIIICTYAVHVCYISYCMMPLSSLHEWGFGGILLRRNVAAWNAHRKPWLCTRQRTAVAGLLKMHWWLQGTHRCFVECLKGTWAWNVRKEIEGPPESPWQFQSAWNEHQQEQQDYVREVQRRGLGDEAVFEHGGTLELVSVLVACYRLYACMQ